MVLQTSQTGKIFMTELLINSLMENDSLETALLMAINVEIQDIDQKRLAKATTASEKHRPNDIKRLFIYVGLPLLARILGLSMKLVPSIQEGGIIIILNPCKQICC